jgi:hypothetical protein
MASLKLNFGDIYKKVGEYLGIPTLTDASDITKCKDLVMRGYRRFLIPLDASTGRIYRWSFLEKTATLSIVANKDTYTLPTGFSSLVAPFTNITPLSWNPKRRPLDWIYLQKSQTTGSGYPSDFAIKTANYNPITGQPDNEVIFWPMPSNPLTYYFTYIQTPIPPINDEDVFIGDVYTSECILQCALAAAETFEKDGVTGQTSGLHNQTAERLIQAAIGEDKLQSQVGNLGSMNTGKNDSYIRSATIQQGYTQIIPTP